MPEELAVVIGVAILAGTFLALVKIILGYLSSRRTPAADAALSQHELERLIEAAVERAVAPLHERLDGLYDRALPPHREDAVLVDEADAPVAARFRR